MYTEDIRYRMSGSRTVCVVVDIVVVVVIVNGSHLDLEFV